MPYPRTRDRVVLAMCTLCIALVAWLGAPLEERADDNDGLRYHANLSFRPIPLGVSTKNDLGWRLSLFDSDSTLLANTYVEAGATTTLSPALAWGGAFIEAVPIAPLLLRASVSYLGYFGNFGFLYLPTDPENPSWTIDDFNRSQDEKAGFSTTGWKFEIGATPRIKVGRLVVLAPIRFARFDMNVDQVYYEPFYDILVEPRDNIVFLDPTVGWLFGADLSETYVLAALRWSRTWTARSDVSRDLITALASWRLPRRWWSRGNPRLISLAGLWVGHPNRLWQPYFALQLAVDY